MVQFLVILLCLTFSSSILQAKQNFPCAGLWIYRREDKAVRLEFLRNGRCNLTDTVSGNGVREKNIQYRQEAGQVIIFVQYRVKPRWLYSTYKITPLGKRGTLEVELLYEQQYVDGTNLSKQTQRYILNEVSKQPVVLSAYHNPNDSADWIPSVILKEGVTFISLTELQRWLNTQSQRYGNSQTIILTRDKKLKRARLKASSLDWLFESNSKSGYGWSQEEKSYISFDLPETTFTINRRLFVPLAPIIQYLKGSLTLDKQMHRLYIYVPPL